MDDSTFFQSGRDGVRSRYRVCVLPEAKVTPVGVSYRAGGDACLVEWSSVQCAIAADVGEPEGVRTIVFDLVVQQSGEGCAVIRIGADPHEDAMAIARLIVAAIGPERAAASIKSLAADGRPSCWFPDLESFEEAALREILA